ncbi:SDR family oxidoreductase [Cupriavidus necator]|uniref:NAD-dependent epimerase/dehydratase:Short-chain dehydrogenase/reductase SDR n=1 Tax=Cupriavidus pinatubonensis (strain JMP 134 / LMG 1197) TaxID=264198 RepID=Q46MP2_CUPPJ|nr:SDR family oxidoreductase [Cupriavidus necator]
MRKQKTALVTGGSNGIGRATAQRLADDGFRLVTVDRAAPKELLQGELFCQADILDASQREDTVARIAREFEVDVLVNNVAVVKLAPVEDVALEDLQTSVDLNVVSGLRFSQAVIPGMKARGYGRIVNIASRAALGKELRTSYAATKAAVIGMTRTWALELAAHGITVNCIGPGPIATEMFRAANPPDSEQTKKIMRTIPVRRLGEPEEIAHAVAFFADEKAGFTTGQVIYVCGGMTVGLTPE